MVRRLLNSISLALNESEIIVDNMMHAEVFMIPDCTSRPPFQLPL